MPLEQYYSVKTLALMMDMAPSTIYDKIYKGEIQCYKFGKSVRVSESQKNEWIALATQKNNKLDLDDLLNKKNVNVKKLLNQK
jgi:excisionase family DNA binding protein